MTLSGWGRFPSRETSLCAPRSEAALREQLRTDSGCIARGNGRAYGDSASGQASTIHMRHFDRFESFDAENGVLVAQAGVLLGDVIAAMLPRGWFPYVTPGTKYVTIGGMIAANVHGKNQHCEGCFGDYVAWIDIMSADGTVTRCSRDEHCDVFEWTIGGMGLTGVILRAAIRLRPVETGWIEQTTIATQNLEETIELFDQHDSATYCVAWIDCLAKGEQLGRSLLMLGEHASETDLDEKQRAERFPSARKPRLNVPFSCPSWLLNRWSMRSFNALYYRVGKQHSSKNLVHWDQYFYPLDTILGWNKIYGRKGFMQFQCVLPPEQSTKGLRALLDATSAAGAGSFLAVLKRFGPQESRFSFPMAGYTLTLDFPVSRKTHALMQQLDDITLQHQGRFYLAKDARLRRETFEASDDRIDAFRGMRSEHQLKPKLESSQSERLAL